MKTWIFILLSMALITCSKDEVGPQKIDGIFAISEVGMANYWNLAKLNQENSDFELVGEKIKLDGFWYGASTILKNKLIVYTTPSLKHIDLITGQITKVAEVDERLAGLEYSETEDVIFAMADAYPTGFYFSSVNYETGEIIRFSNILTRIEGTVSPSTLVDDTKYYVIGETGNHVRKIFLFSTLNGALVKDVAIPTNFPHHIVCGLEYNETDQLIYFLDERPDRLWNLMSLNPGNLEIKKFADGITLGDNIDATLIDQHENVYIIQNSNSGTNTLTVVNLVTGQIDQKIGDQRVIELNQN